MASAIQSINDLLAGWLREAGLGGHSGESLALGSVDQIGRTQDTEDEAEQEEQDPLIDLNPGHVDGDNEDEQGHRPTHHAFFSVVGDEVEEKKNEKIFLGAAITARDSNTADLSSRPDYDLALKSLIVALQQRAEEGLAFDSLSKLFGDDIDANKVQGLNDLWLQGDSTWIPSIQFKTDDELGATAAYAAATNIIYINQSSWEILSEHDKVVVLLEEIGHSVENRLRPGIDTPGDEGRSFRDWVIEGEIRSAGDINNYADDHIIRNIGGVSTNLEAAALSFNWSRNLDFSRSLALNFNSLVGLPSNGLQIPKTGGKGELFNIDNFIGKGSKELPIFGGLAGLRGDLDAAIGYDYGMKLDLGKANASLSGGLDIGIKAVLPSISTITNQADPNINGSLDFNLNIKPITLDWGLTTPSFKAWAYLLYSAGIDLDYFYKLPLPNWVPNGIRERAQGSGDIFTFKTEGKIGKEIGFDAKQYGGKIDVTSGVNLSAGTTVQSPVAKAPDWSQDLIPNVNLKLFSPSLPSPRVSSNGVSLSSQFPVFKLTADLDQALATLTGIPFSGNFKLDAGAFGLSADYALLDLNPTLQLDAYYNLDLKFESPDFIDVYNLDVADPRQSNTPIAVLKKIDQYKDVENKISSFIASRPLDTNKNFQYDLDFVWKPKVVLSASAGFISEAYLDYKALTAKIGAKVDINLFLGKIKKDWGLTLGPLFDGKLQLWKESVELLPADKRSIDITPNFMQAISVPLSVPRALNDPSTFDLNIYRGPDENNSKPIALPSQTKTVVLPKLKNPQLNFIISPSASGENNIEFNGSNGFNNFGVDIQGLDPLQNWTFTSNGSKLVSQASLANQPIKNVNLPIKNTSQRIDLVVFNDSSSKDTTVEVDTYIGNLSDGNDLFRGNASSSIILFGDGEDTAIVRDDNNHGNTQAYKETVEGLLTQYFRTSIQDSPLRLNKNGTGYYDFGSGSDKLNLESYGSDKLNLESYENYSEVNEFIFRLDSGALDAIRISPDLGNGGQSFYGHGQNVIRLLGTDASRGKSDSLNVGYTQTAGSSSPQLSGISVNKGLGRSADITFDPYNPVFSNGTLTLLDYSLVNPSTISTDLEGVTLQVGSKDQVIPAGLFDFHSPTNKASLTFGSGKLSTPILTAKVFYSQSSQFSTPILTLVAIRGSQLNDTISISNEFILTAEGLGGDDNYIIDAPFLPGNSRFGLTNQTALSSSQFALPAASKMPRATFLYDAQGHSTVSLGDGSIDSFYRYGANLINLDLQSIISSRVSDFITTDRDVPYRLVKGNLIPIEVDINRLLSYQNANLFGLDDVTTGLGTWQFKLAGTNHWVTIRSELLNDNLLLLGKEDKLRLLPDGDLNSVNLNNALSYRVSTSSSGQLRHGTYVSEATEGKNFSEFSIIEAIEFNASNSAAYRLDEGKQAIPVGTNIDEGDSMVVQADGKIIVAGTSKIGSSSNFSLIRLNTDGSLDPSFNGTGKQIIPLGADAQGHSVVVQADGKIIVAGESSNNSTDFGDFSLIRLNPDGSLDTSFNQTGKQIISVGNNYDKGNEVVVQADGKIIVAGYSLNKNGLDFSLIRVNPDGSLDTSFNQTGKQIIPVGTGGDEGNSVALQADGKIIVAGTSGHPIAGTFLEDNDFSLIRLNSDGSLDPSFNGTGRQIIPISSYFEQGQSVVVQADGKIIVAGHSANDDSYNIGLIRLNPNGSLDTSFNGTGKQIIPIGADLDVANSMVLQADGKIIVAGTSKIGSSFNFSLIRLNTDGSLDPSFNGTGKQIIPVGIGDDSGKSVVVQADGKIIIAGTSKINENYDFSLIRLNSDGSLDKTFAQPAISVPFTAVKTLPSSFDTTDLPSWTLDLTSLSNSVDTTKVYNLDSINTLRPKFLQNVFQYAELYKGKTYVDMPTEIILGNRDNVFDPAAIWDTYDEVTGTIYEPINKYLPGFGLYYRLGSGNDKIKGYTPKDIFDVTNGTKQISDNVATDNDTLVINRPIGSITLATIDFSSNHYKVLFNDANNNYVDLLNIENIAFRFADDSSTLLTYKVKDLFATPPLMVRGIPEDRFVQWQKGSVERSELLQLTLNISNADITNTAATFGLSNGRLILPKQVFTSRLTALDGSIVDLVIPGTVDLLDGNGQVKVATEGNQVVLSRPNGFGVDEVYTLPFSLSAGGRSFESTFAFVVSDFKAGKAIDIMSDQGVVKSENGEEVLTATVGGGATITTGSVLKLADSNKDGVIKGREASLDINQDGIIDSLPATSILVSGVLQFSVSVGDKPQETKETILDVKLANPILANQYFKFFNDKWNNFIYDPSKPALGGAELLDVNRDGLIESIKLHLFDGGPGDNDGIINGLIDDPGILAIDNSVSINLSSAGYIIQRTGSSAPIAVTYNGIKTSLEFPGSGWELIKALADSVGYKVYWKNRSNGDYAEWSLNEQGALADSFVFNEAQLSRIESAHDFDINGDGNIDQQVSPLAPSPNSLVLAFENYQFYYLGGNRQGIQKKGTGAIDEITGISSLTFNDTKVSVSDNIIGVFNQVTGKETKDAQMFRLYNASFNRFPDSDGLKYWINEYSKGITDYRNIAESFIISSEFKQRYGALNTNLEFATNMYKNILGRLPDSEGLNYWVSNLNAGTNSRVDVLGGFSESVENKNLFSQVTGFI